MDVKGKVFLQLFNKRKLRNGTKTYLDKFFSLFLVKFKKLGFSAPLKVKYSYNFLTKARWDQYFLATNCFSIFNQI